MFVGESFSTEGVEVGMNNGTVGGGIACDINEGK